MSKQDQFIDSFNNIQNDIHTTAREKGWWDKPEWLDELKMMVPVRIYEQVSKAVERNQGEMIALMHSELSEGLEGIREGLQSDKVPEFSSIEEELADTIIRIMDYAAGHQLHVAEAIIAKMQYNAGRSHKHGGKKF